MRKNKLYVNKVQSTHQTLGMKAVKYIFFKSNLIKLIHTNSCLSLPRRASDSIGLEWVPKLIIFINPLISNKHPG